MEGTDMLKDVIAAGGSGLLIPAVLFAVVLYVVRGLFGLHGRKSQHRREFLERWDPGRIEDGLWLEVTVRQLYGAYLPAHVIRTALAQPHASLALIELSELWPLLHYDPDSRTVRWRHRRHRHPTMRRLARYWPTTRYVLLALGASLAMLASYRSDGLIQWIFAVLAVVLVAGAFVSLTSDDAEKIADTVGVAWIDSINQSLDCRNDQPAPEMEPD